MKKNLTSYSRIAIATSLKTPGIFLLKSIFFVGLTSCGTIPAEPPLESGVALIDATPATKHRAHIRGITIMTINGRSAKGGEEVLRPGYNDVKIRFDWPQGGNQEVNLKFNAMKNQRYFVQYAPYPNHPSRSSIADYPNQRSTGQKAAGTLLDLGSEMGYLGAVMILPAMGVGVADMGYQSVKTVIPEGAGNALSFKPADYVDVSVISKDPTEGVVRRVRVYADGRVDSKSWDAWSNAPAS